MATLPHRFEFRIAVIAAFALFIAQFGALAHAYSHDPALAPASAQQPKAGNHGSCDDCLNFAPLLAPAGTPSLLPPDLPRGTDAPERRAVAAFVQYRTLLAFRSRAPPVAR